MKNRVANLCFILATTLMFSITLVAKELSKNESLSCEAILCLSSVKRPSECKTAVKHYYSIVAKKPSDTIKKRKKFLSLCPVENNKELSDLKDKILNDEYLYDKCDISYLNKRVEKKAILSDNRFEKAYRINPKTEIPCKSVKYICSKEFYRQDEWDRGYKLIKIPLKEYEKLPKDQTKSILECSDISEKSHCKTKYYKKEMINKSCWVSSNEF